MYLLSAETLEKVPAEDVGESFALTLLTAGSPVLALQAVTYVTVVFSQGSPDEKSTDVSSRSPVNMERRTPSREGSRRLSAKPSKGSEMKKVSVSSPLAAAESDKDSVDFQVKITLSFLHRSE